MGRTFLRSFATTMRNTIITIAAWTAAIATVFWQRLLWPGLKSFFPGIEDLFSEPRTPVRESTVPPQLETLVIECQPARPQRVSTAKPKARTAAPKAKSRAVAGFTA